MLNENILRSVTMKTINFTLPYPDATLVIDALRHYIKYIDEIDQKTIDDDTYADLVNDIEQIKALEKNFSALFTKKIGPY